MSYYDLYKVRLNRFGENYAERMQGAREKQFEVYLQSCTTKISFNYNNRTWVGSFERYQQDQTKTLAYLLTDVDLTIPGGTVLQLPDKDGTNKAWMVYYFETIQASGYNRYIMLRMTHYLAYTDKDGVSRYTYGYLYGPMNAAIINSLQSSKSTVYYAEDNNTYRFIVPLNEYIKKGDYLVSGTGNTQDQFVVKGFDRQSVEGVEYLTIDPIYAYDFTPAPTKQEGEDPAEYYWLNGGN